MGANATTEVNIPAPAPAAPAPSAFVDTPPVAAPPPVVAPPAAAPIASSPPSAAVPPPAFGVAASAPVASPVAETAAATATPWEEATTPPVARPPLFDAEPEPEHLDDDAFFASLREAVTDETPLGPRDTAPPADVFDQDDQRGGLFRRRGR